MTTPATASRKRVGAIVETTWGTTPASPTILGIPYINFKLDPTLDIYDDAATYGDRMSRYSLAGNLHVTGELDVQLSPLTFDNLWASAMNGTWATNVLITGTTQSSLTFEEQQLDTSVYSVSTGVMVDKVAVTIPASGMVTAKFSLVGKSFSQSTSALTGETFTAPTVAKAFIHNTGTFKIGGTTVGHFTSVTLNIDNKLNANMGLGSTTVQSITYGDSTVSGSVTVYFIDDTTRASFLTNTPTSLEFDLTNGTNTLNIVLPNITFKTSTRASSKNGVVTETYNFVANFDNATSTNVKLTRS